MHSHRGRWERGGKDELYNRLQVSVEILKEQKIISKTNKTPTHKPLNNISEQKISIFVKKQDIINECFKKVA
jgi:hypothetical protein